tara:strand:+ start:148 stop:2190 length:2043 start_codon:yes stop_codon:yes gene_type:complete
MNYEAQALLNDAQEELNMENDGLTLIELQGYVGSVIDDSKVYIDDDISPNRARATQYFMGEPFGNEEAGSSTIVDMTVRDTVGKIMPALMRVFFSTENVVQFSARSEGDTIFAEMATDYVNYVLNNDNNLYLELQSAWQDALVRKTGIVKYWWDSNGEDESHEMTGITEEALIALQADEEISIEILTTDETQQFFDVKVTHSTKNGRVRIKALPCEEFLIDRSATSLEDAIMTAHRSMLTVSELVQMGYDQDMVESMSSGVDELDDNVERRTRNPAALNYGFRTQEATRLVEYVEVYMKVDWNNDGIAELRKICCMGSSYEIVHHEAWDTPPFAVFNPLPDSHVFFGTSIFDLVGDIQLIKSNVLRNMLDSLSLSVHPRVAVVEGQVNIDDVTNTEVGAIIRQTQPGAVTPFNLPFVGKEAFPMLGYLDSMKEGRTGISKASMGLDAESLQSTTASAVNATIQGAQAQIELIARNFSEIGMRQLVQGVFGLLMRHQDYERIVRLRDEWVPIDPRSWKSEMDVVINLPVGGQSDREKQQAMAAIINKQEEIINKFGVQNPLVSLEKYRNAIKASINLAGFKNTKQFINEGKIELPPTPPPQPTSEELLIETQRESIQADIQKKAAELELRRQEMIRDDDFRHDKLEAEIMMEAANIKAKYATELDVQQIKEMIDVQRAENV